MSHHEWTITVYENGKFLLNLSLSDTEIIVSRKTIGCHKDSVSDYILSTRAVGTETDKLSL